MVTSIEPNTTPVARNASAITRRPGSRSGEAAALPSAAGGWTGGSVRRWAANSSAPVVPKVPAAISPASGNSEVQSSIASTGPAMKQSSSSDCSSELAMCRASGSSRCTWAQRALAIPPRFGAKEAAAQQAYSVQSGAPRWTHSSRALIGRTLRTVAGTVTRACP